MYDYAPVHSGRAIVTGVGDENSAGVSINLGVHENRDKYRSHPSVFSWFTPDRIVVSDVSSAVFDLS